MKITRRQLRRLVLEAFPIKTVTQDQYDPPAAFKDSLSPRTEEAPKKKDIVGKFFMTKLTEKLPHGYSSLKKLRYFYMILPDGDSITIGSMRVSDNEGRVYLNLLSNTVTPLQVDDYLNPSEQDSVNIREMQQSVLRAREIFKYL